MQGNNRTRKKYRASTLQLAHVHTCFAHKHTHTHTHTNYIHNKNHRSKGRCIPRATSLLLDKQTDSWADCQNRVGLRDDLGVLKKKKKNQWQNERRLSLSHKRCAMQKWSPAPPGWVFKRVRNFFCFKTRFQGLRSFWVAIVVVRHIVYCECFSGFRADVPCCTTETCSIITIQTGRCGSIFFFCYIVVELACTHRVCMCSLVVVRHNIYCECFSSYRVDFSCCSNEICLFVTVSTGRWGQLFFFNLFVAEFEWKYRVFECSFVVVRHFVCCECFSRYRADLPCCTNGICSISIVQTDRCGRICFLFLITYCFIIWMSISCFWVEPCAVWHSIWD